MVLSRREHLVETAADLFRRHGYHATGIDRILAESGCAKMTLYKHFKSKDELILAALRRQDEQFRNDLMRDVERRAETPRGRLLAVFDSLGAYIAEPGFSGCMFVHAAGEFAAPDDPIHAAAAEHKRLIRGYLADLAEQAGAPDPTVLARSLMLLIEGAISMAHVSGNETAAVDARDAARVLIEHALGSSA